MAALYVPSGPAYGEATVVTSSDAGCTARAKPAYWAGNIRPESIAPVTPGRMLACGWWLQTR